MQEFSTRDLSLLENKKGQVALVTVFLIGSFIILIALTLAFLSISAINSNLAVQSASRALSVASAGVQDGILRLIRNNAFAGSYTLNVNGDTASISVTNTVSSNNQATILSSSTVAVSQRAIQAIVLVASSTSQVSILSWRQL